MVNKRHVYTACGDGRTLNWDAAWYTQDWFTRSRDFYDGQASVGPVDPPQSVWEGDPACQTILTGLGLATATATPTSTMPTAAAASTVNIIVPLTRSMKTVSAGPPPIATGTATALSVAMTSSTEALGSSSAFGSSSTGPTSSPSFIFNSTVPSTTTICAGGWDWMATGAVSSGLFGVLIGVTVWLAFGAVRRKVPMYLTNMWFLPEDRRPSGLPSFFGSFSLIPILKFVTLHKRSQDAVEAPNDAQIGVLTVLTALKLAAFGSIVGLAAGLPLFLVGVPCLGKTAPMSQFGGRYGTLSDLSILRLLDALDPSPDSEMATGARRLAERALSSTIAPSVPSARTRLVILLAIMVAMFILPSLFVVMRTLVSLLSYRKKWLAETCGGEEIVFVRLSPRGRSAGSRNEKHVMQLAEACGLTAKSERLSRHSNDDSQRDPQCKQDEKPSTATIRAAFAIPETKRLAKLIRERDKTLNALERSETLYIESFWLSKDTVSPGDSSERRMPSRTASRRSTHSTRRRTRLDGDDAQTGGQFAPTTYVAPRSYYHLEAPTVKRPSAVSAIEEAPVSPADSAFAHQVRTRMTGTNFLEVTRDSAFFGGKIPVGTAMKVGQGGLLDIDREPKSCGPRIEEESPRKEHGPSESNKPKRLARSRPTQPLKAPQSPETEVKAGSLRNLKESDVASESLGIPAGKSPTHKTMTALGSAPTTATSLGVLSAATVMAHPPPSSPRSSSFEFLPDIDPELRLGHNPAVRPVSGATRVLGRYYQDIKTYRLRLKELNEVISLEQAALYEDMAEDKHIKGFMLIGSGIAQLGKQVYGRTREDVLWEELQSGRGSLFGYWFLVTLIVFVSGIAATPFVALGVGTAPGFSHYLGLMLPLARDNGIISGLAEGLAAGLAIILILSLSAWAIVGCTHLGGVISRVHRRLLALQGITPLLLVNAGLWVLVSAGSMFATEHIDIGIGISRYLADGSVFISWMLFCLLLNVAIVIPGLLLLRPHRLLLYRKRMCGAVTPRDRFRIIAPHAFDPTLAFAGCLLALLYGSTFFFIFPLISLPIVLFLVLMLVATHYTAKYVHANVEGDSGALYAIWSLRVFGWVLSAGPLMFGLLLMSRREWTIGGVALGVSVAVLLAVELLLHKRMRSASNGSTADKNALDRFRKELCRDSSSRVAADGAETEALSPRTDEDITRQRRHSTMSIFELIAGITSNGMRVRTGPLPLATDSIDDMFSTEQAARAHPSVPPRLPPLPFDEVADQCRHLMYPPALLAPPPLIWLPDDEAGVGRAEAADLDRYHQLKAIVDQGAVDEWDRD